MAKRKVIWSNTAIKRLYSIFETDIRKGNAKEDSINDFQIISRNLKGIRKNPKAGIRTSEISIYGVKADTFLILYTLTENEIVIHTLLKD
ncbi:MAG: hypothetical protein IPH69_08515 [Bacteroidales bacterium]|nr:hypothetical protein [Bacteroidales bacterium]